MGKSHSRSGVNRLAPLPGLGIINVDHAGRDRGVSSAQCGGFRAQGCIPDSGRRPSEGHAERYFHVLTKAVGMRE